MPRENSKSKIQDRKGRVIVVGSSNTDLVVRCDKLPQPGETVLGGDMETFAGGKGANQAIAAARAGAKVFFIGAFGDDAFGRARRADLEREGVDCSGCVIKKGVPSGVALIAVGSSGKGKRRAKAENQILVAPGANARLTAADIRLGMPKDSCYDDVVLISLEIPIQAVSVAIKNIRNTCSNIVLNPAPIPRRRLPTELLERCPVITPNESEFRALFGNDREPSRSEILRSMLRHNLLNIVVTRGSKAALWYYIFREGSGASSDPFYEDESGVVWNVTGPVGKDKLGTTSFLPPPVNVIDSVGAGDCFNGSLAARMASSQCNVDEAIPFAIAAAAIQVTRRGAQAAMPYRHEILKMLKRMKS